MDLKIYDILQEKLKANIRTALVTITKESGSAPRGVGSMMLVDEAGNLIYGTIGGGSIEHAAMREAKEAIALDKSTSVAYALDEKGKLGMACGGIVEVFIQVHKADDHIVIVGGGHICEKLYHFLKILPYRMSIIDHREAFANSEKYPEAHCESGDVVKILKGLELTASTSVVIVTHGHLFDLEALQVVINQPVRYIGMIGSCKKILKCYEALKSQGITNKQLETVYAPIGLDIGGERPEEIALAILAEIQSVKYQKTNQHLSVKHHIVNKLT